MRKIVALILILSSPAWAARKFVAASSQCMTFGASLVTFTGATPQHAISIMAKNTTATGNPHMSRWNGGASTDYVTWTTNNPPPGGGGIAEQVTSAFRTCAPADNPANGVWYQAGFWYDGVRGSVNGRPIVEYYNGSSHCTLATANDFTSSGFAFRIGCSANNANYFNGALAEAADWNISAVAGGLSPDEYLALGKGVPPILVHGGSTLIFYMPMHGLVCPEPEMSGNQRTASGTCTNTPTGTTGNTSTSWTSTINGQGAY